MLNASPHYRICEFKFSAEDVNLSKENLLSWLNYDVANFPPFLEEAMLKSIEIISNHAEPSGGFILFSDEMVSFKPDSIYINDLCLKSEKIISRYFKGAKCLAIMLATIGNNPEKYSKEFIGDGDLLTGYIIDAAASVSVEKTADLVERKLNEIVREDNLYATNRYSPGYCGWNVNDQHKLFSLLPKEFCGVLLNESAMMIPVKSISAIVGIGNNVTKEEYDCELCDVEFCYKRNNQYSI